VYDPTNDSSDSAGGQPAPVALPDLPPVEPPSAKFVIQLFVIPAAVVVVVIIVWLLFGKLAGGERDPMDYVRELRHPGANWRLAFELANLIQHNPRIGSDPILLGELSDLLSHELDQNSADPQLTQYLALTLGAFQTLEASTQSGQKIDPLVPLARALEPQYPGPVRIAAAASLAKQAARTDGKLDDPRAVRALAQTAATADPELRQLSVYALGFFGGPAALEALRERIRTDEDRFVRYNAAVALARHGDTASVSTLREMLTTSDLNKVIDLRSTTEKQNKIESIELEAIEALRTSLSTASPELARTLEPQLDTLTNSGLVSVRSQARQVLQILQSKP
jgi:DNA-binding transcriptional regulator YiaG